MSLTSVATGDALPLPPPELRYMQESDDVFVSTAGELASVVGSELSPGGGLVLDVGCAYGRLALGLLATPNLEVSYLGFDILREPIEWCQQTITPLAPDFEFRYLDVRNDKYNPDGQLDPSDFTFPVESGRVACCTLFSVLTHLYEADVRRYLSEIARVLSSDGAAVTTWLLWDDERMAAVEQSRFKMRHVIDANIKTTDPDNPLGAIGYEQSYLLRLIDEAGLQARIERGKWARDSGPTFQDLVVLKRKS